uniref:Uncharacterized protein n=1 Tax=Cacopsylla melanoneura TaxID=428564 RepID=A0A8D8TML0_9HEMI
MNNIISSRKIFTMLTRQASQLYRISPLKRQKTSHVHRRTGHITAEICMNAAGGYMPTMLVFPRKKSNTGLLDGGIFPPNWFKKKLLGKNLGRGISGLNFGFKKMGKTQDNQLACAD